jgi:hypothetical protein
LQEVFLARLEKITHIVLIFVALAALGMMADKMYVHPTQQRAPRLVGRSITLPQVQWSSTRYNVILAISSACHYCRESAAFYHGLAQLPDQANLIVVSSDERNEIERFLTTHGISATQIVSATLADIGVHGTPTVLVVDQKGIVRKALAGKQPPEVEADFLSQVRERSL